MLSILITGSNGLIGKTLSSQLKKTTFEIKEVDINFPLTHPNFGDINNVDSIRHLFRDCIGVIHLAAVSRVVWGEDDPAKCWQVNVLGTQNILELALSSPHKPWVIYASSREVYGQQEQLPVKESATLQPLNAYARSKVAAEALVKEYQLRGLRTAILRFSSVYGRVDDHANRVIPAFCQAAVFGKSLIIEGSNNIFDFTHVSDVANGILNTINLLQKNFIIPSAIHLTTGRATSLRQIAEYACELTNNKSELVEAPPRTYDVSRFIGEPHLAFALLNWSSKINIMDGIKQMIKGYERIQQFKNKLYQVI